MTWYMLDVESDGPVPGIYNLIQIGVVIVQEPLEQAPFFYETVRPISDKFEPEALAVVGVTRDQTLKYTDPVHAMTRLEEWVKETTGKTRPMLISDNNGFDAAFISYYMHRMLGRNIFGHSSTNLGSLYKGLVGDTFKNFKHLRVTKHDHNPVNDARGNAEALLYMKNEMGLNIRL